MIERLLTFLNTIPDDKVRHALGGAVIASVSILLAACLTPLWAVVVATILLVCVAIGKEVYDKLHPPHECSVYDALATVVGGLIVILPLLIVLCRYS